MENTDTVMSKEERHHLLALIGIGCDMAAILGGVAIYVFAAGAMNGLWPKISDVAMLILILMTLFTLYGGIFEVVALIRRDVSLRIRILSGILVVIAVFFLIKVQFVFGALA